jgi:hypothetical protein
MAEAMIAMIACHDEDDDEDHERDGGGGRAGS